MTLRPRCPAYPFDSLCLNRLRPKPPQHITGTRRFSRRLPESGQRCSCEAFLSIYPSDKEPGLPGSSLYQQSGYRHFVELFPRCTAKWRSHFAAVCSGMEGIFSKFQRKPPHMSLVCDLKSEGSVASTPPVADKEEAEEAGETSNANGSEQCAD